MKITYLNKLDDDRPSDGSTPIAVQHIVELGLDYDSVLDAVYLAGLRDAIDGQYVGGVFERGKKKELLSLMTHAVKSAMADAESQLTLGAVAQVMELECDTQESEKKIKVGDRFSLNGKRYCLEEQRRQLVVSNFSTRQDFANDQHNKGINQNGLIADELKKVPGWLCGSGDFDSSWEIKLDRRTTASKTLNDERDVIADEGCFSPFCDGTKLVLLLGMACRSPDADAVIVIDDLLSQKNAASLNTLGDIDDENKLHWAFHFLNKNRGLIPAGQRLQAYYFNTYIDEENSFSPVYDFVGTSAVSPEQYQKIIHSLVIGMALSSRAPIVSARAQVIPGLLSSQLVQLREAMQDQDNNGTLKELQRCLLGTVEPAPEAPEEGVGSSSDEFDASWADDLVVEDDDQSDASTWSAASFWQSVSGTVADAAGAVTDAAGAVTGAAGAVVGAVVDTVTDAIASRR